MGHHDDRLRPVFFPDVIIDDPHVLDDLVPAVCIGEVAAVALGQAMAAVVMAVNDIAAPGRRIRKSAVAPDVLAEPVQQLYHATGFAGGRPGLKVDLVAVPGSEDGLLVVRFDHDRRGSGVETAARPSSSNRPSLTSSSVE